MSIIPNSESLTVGKYGSIGQAYENSIWFYRFVTGLCDYYGYPATRSECYTKNDRLMYAWAVMNVVKSLKEYEVLWINGVDKFDVSLLVESFAEAVYDLSGENIIPPFTGGLEK